MSKLKFIVAGCGYIGRRHAHTIMQHPGCELTAVIDNNPACLEYFSSQGISSFASLESCLAEIPDADAIVIATPNGTHAALALQALDSNLHVLIEKPMALKAQDAEQVLQKAAAVNRKVMVVLQNRFSPVSKWLKTLVADGILGQLYFVEVACYWNRDARYYTKGSWHGTTDLDGGTLFTQFSHFIDMLNWLFGDITNINSRFFNFSHQELTSFEDTGAVVFDFVNGGAGCFNFSTAAWDQNLESSITILAEKGTVKVSGQYMNKVEYCHVKDYQLPLDLLHDDASLNNRQMLDAMVNAVRHSGISNAAEGAKAVDIIERMYMAGKKNSNTGS